MRPDITRREEARLEATGSDMAYQVFLCGCGRFRPANAGAERLLRSDGVWHDELRPDATSSDETGMDMMHTATLRIAEICGLSFPLRLAFTEGRPERIALLL